MLEFRLVEPGKYLRTRSADRVYYLSSKHQDSPVGYTRKGQGLCRQAQRPPRFFDAWRWMITWGSTRFPSCLSWGIFLPRLEVVRLLHSILCWSLFASFYGRRGPSYVYIFLGQSVQGNSGVYVVGPVADFITTPRDVVRFQQFRDVALSIVE